MKRYLFPSLLAALIFSLLGCQQTAIKTESQIKQQDTAGFIEPEPSDWVKYTKAVTKYMYYRTQAVVNNDIHLLWDQYPDLKNDQDLKKGINVEKDEVESLNENFQLIDANYSIESHDRVKVKVINDEEVIVLVHGGIGYLRDDFGESGGELLIEISLKRKNNQWTVVKTDGYTEPEYKEWIKEQNK
ncbi:hypothetical protein [Bacillus sp. REN10]|uniref:hypothetical protein n=1 Tax=Bacillus sp. REN10 TaxID=2782541 RepID=UPI00193BCA41|nr:hypothetical protein [Bacillus sp. REN10]